MIADTVPDWLVPSTKSLPPMCSTIGLKQLICFKGPSPLTDQGELLHILVGWLVAKKLAAKVQYHDFN